jgi:hypothetical protein
MPAHLYSFTVRLEEQKRSFIFHSMCTGHQICCLGASLGKMWKVFCWVVDSVSDYGPTISLDQSLLAFLGSGELAFAVYFLGVYGVLST